MAEPEFREGAWWFRQPDGTLLRWDQEERARRVAESGPATATA